MHPEDSASNSLVITELVSIWVFLSIVTLGHTIVPVPKKVVASIPTDRELD